VFNRLLSFILKQRPDKRLGQRLPSAQATEQGLTLLECLVAITVIALTTSVITPVVVVAVASRVQNQQAEQAFQLAQSEVDRVRLILERGGTYNKNTIAIASVPGLTAISTVGVPTTINASTFSTSATAVKPIDVNGDGRSDFVVQAFRTPGIAASSTAADVPVAFDMGVRVYRFSDVDAGKTLSAQPANLTLTASSEDRGSGGGVRPLAVLYTTVIKGDRTDSLCKYYAYLGSTPASTSGIVCN
jgi:prepilin-type N-terminal cleavage/methylation domain-containing protein